MRKRILSILPVLCILLTLIPSALAAGPEIGTLQIQNQTYQNGALSFTAALSGTSGRLAVCVYKADRQMKDIEFYPAASTVNVSLQNVSDTDTVKAVWLDDGYCALAEPALLHPGGSGTADYAKFTGELQSMLDRYGDAGSESDDPDDPYALSRLLVRCDALPNLDGWNVLASVQGPDGLYVLQFQTPAQAKDCAEHLLTYPSVVYAVPDAVTQMDEPSAESLAALADSGSHLSWGVEATGIGQYAEALKSRGVTGGVTVAVVDSGIDMDHPFLAGKYLSGYDYVENDSVPQDEFRHGTHVAGIVADCTAGLDVKILPVRVLDKDGRCPTLVWITNGIRYAADHGADVINLSLSAPVSEHIDYEVQYAVSKNITVVAAAGNQAGDTSARSPAHIAECITVSAVNEAKKTLPHSNFGDAVDLAAPGERVLSAVPRGKGTGYSDRNYEYMSGTSMAAPHVSAAAALLLCDRGRSLTPAQISDTLRSAAQDLGTPGWDRKFGVGMLNLRPF
ncbi:MAG: S8 family serine peptidase, partial [Oscillibacter sp.]|nr:S8 family serine peptidase [Oscillibacter sp.]